MDKTAAIESFLGEYGLTELQISTILKLFESYLADNSIAKKDGVFEVCPKCGMVHPMIVKGGKAGSGKQMYRCTHCGRRFTEDHGTIMHYSHQGDDAWKVLMMDTINGVSLKKTSAKLSLSIGPVFSMRHRFLCSLEKYADNIKVSRNVQLDESQDPINPDILMAGSCSMTTDGTFYDQLASATGTFHRKTEDRKDSKAEVNLNRSNSFHSVIKSYYRHYRGVANKYINRYSSIFAYAWNVNKVVKEGERYEHALSTVRKDGISLTGEELRNYRLYAPADLIYRAA